MSKKIFVELEKEIVNKGLCTFCGGCLAVCTSTGIEALCVEDNKPKYIDVPGVSKKCLDCGLCYLVCSQIQDLNPDIDDQYSMKPPLGSYKYLTSTRTTNPEIQKVAQDGGIVTAILKHLFENNLIDGAVVNLPTGNWESKPILVTAPDQLIKAAGTRYSVSPSLQELGNYQKLNKTEPRLALVGCPCQIQAVRKMQVLNARPGIFVKYLIGLFCMENFDYHALIKEKIENELKIDLNSIRKLNIKGNFLIQLNDGKQIEIPLKDMGNLVRHNCHYCSDFTNFYADISVGGIGSPSGYSTVLVRTEIGDGIFTEMKKKKLVEEAVPENMTIRQLNAKILKLISKLGQNKYEKGKKNRADIQTLKVNE